MSTQYARAEAKSAALHTDFAREFLRKRLSVAVYEALYAEIPRYSRGPRRGLEKGYVHWIKVTEGGWSRQRGGVLLPGTREVRICWACDPQSSVLLDPGAWSTDEMRVAHMRAQIERLTSKVRRYG